MRNKQVVHGSLLLQEEKMGITTNVKLRCPFCGAIEATIMTIEKHTVDCSQKRVIYEEGSTSLLCAACGIPRGHGYGVMYLA